MNNDLLKNMNTELCALLLRLIEKNDLNLMHEVLEITKSISESNI